MQASDSFNADQIAEEAGKISNDFDAKLRFVPPDVNEARRCHLPHEVYDNVEKSLEDQYNNHPEDRNEESRESDEDDDFSFVLNADDMTPISADEAFQNGLIRPVFPLFNRDLLLSDEDSDGLEYRLLLNPPVKKVFVEAPELAASSSSSSAGTDDLHGMTAGPYCEWSKKSSEEAREGCKKSNSTGFSKLWRIRDFRYRSNSDGRDVFVFLNNSNAPTRMKKDGKAAEKREDSSEKKNSGEPKEEKRPADGAGKKVKTRKGNKAETSSLSAYMRDRASEEDRRRSYLPYRPELVGFFTNVSGGGLSRNIHPF